MSHESPVPAVARVPVCHIARFHLKRPAAICGAEADHLIKEPPAARDLQPHKPILAGEELKVRVAPRVRRPPSATLRANADKESRSCSTKKRNFSSGSDPPATSPRNGCECSPDQMRSQSARSRAENGCPVLPAVDDVVIRAP
jgi:hypothetical protein